MTQEEKQLLLKDLSARLPYGVQINIRSFNPETNIDAYLTTFSIETLCDGNIEVRPYLRPMSSMTEKEKARMKELVYNMSIFISPLPVFVIYESDVATYIDFCHKHHLDWRGLIPMGLALEAPKDMYKTE